MKTFKSGDKVIIVGVIEGKYLTSDSEQIIQHYEPQELIIGKEYEFSDDGEEWYVDKFDGYATPDGCGYTYISPIQRNPEEEEFLKLAEKLGYNVNKK